MMCFFRFPAQRNEPDQGCVTLSGDNKAWLREKVQNANMCSEKLMTPDPSRARDLCAFWNDPQTFDRLKVLTRILSLARCIIWSSAHEYVRITAGHAPPFHFISRELR
jgi:hypothetical protein